MSEMEDIEALSIKIKKFEWDKYNVGFTLRMMISKYDKFQKLWEEIEDLLIEEYETEEDAKIIHTVLDRTKTFETGKSKGYSQEEVEKMYGVSR